MSGADNTRWKAPPTTRDAMDMSASTCQHCALIGARHSAPGRECDQAGPKVSLLLADQEPSRAIKEAQPLPETVAAPAKPKRSKRVGEPKPKRYPVGEQGTEQGAS
jgi:hypothetical protein